eukprot:3051610-Rhodomonas_salina.1
MTEKVTFQRSPRKDLEDRDFRGKLALRLAYRHCRAPTVNSSATGWVTGTAGPLQLTPQLLTSQYWHS